MEILFGGYKRSGYGYGYGCGYGYGHGHGHGEGREAMPDLQRGQKRVHGAKILATRVCALWGGRAHVPACLVVGGGLGGAISPGSPGGAPHCRTRG